MDFVVDIDDILSTVLIMLGLSYNSSEFVGKDAFSTDRDNYIYFSEDIFFDGNKFFDENTDKDVLDIMSKDTKKKMELNKNFIISDYFRDK